MARKISRGIELNKIENYTYILHRAGAEVKGRIRTVMESWAAGTKTAYDSLTHYGGGFKAVPGKSFAKVESLKSGDGLYVAVGHEAFIAKFLEVGTKAHTIKHKTYEVQVRGIKGSKALKQVWDKNEKNIIPAIEKELLELLKGG